MFSFYNDEVKARKVILNLFKIPEECVKIDFYIIRIDNSSFYVRRKGRKL